MSIKKLLVDARLYREYQRMSALDPRVDGLVKEMLEMKASIGESRREEMLVECMKTAMKTVRWHFRYSDPGLAASLAMQDFHSSLAKIKKDILEAKL